MVLGVAVLGGVLISAPVSATHAATGVGSSFGFEVAIVRTLPAPAPVPRPDRLGEPEARFARLCPKVPRATRDRPDIEDGPLVHVVYLVPDDFPDEKLDVNGTLHCSILGQQLWFREQSDGLEWRVDSFKTKVADGGSRARTVEITDVSFVESALSGAALSGGSAVLRELQVRGFDEEDKRYLTYVASESAACGDALFPISSDPAADGKYAQVYLFSEGCHSHDFGSPLEPGYPEMIAQQELMHNDALTPIGAPHTCLIVPPFAFAHVCTPLVKTEGGLNLDPERIDVMYPYISVPLSEKLLDRGHDDYFQHLMPGVRDLDQSPYVRSVKRAGQQVSL